MAAWWWWWGRGDSDRGRGFIIIRIRGMQRVKQGGDMVSYINIYIIC